MISSVEWMIPPENVKKYENLFETMEQSSGKVSGEVMNKFLRGTKLPVETLCSIWDLSDLDRDGRLDRFEFILTMHLVCLCLEGHPLPQTLPLDLVPPNKRVGFSEPLALMPPPLFISSNHDLPSLSTSSSLGVSSLAVGPPQPSPDWAISKAAQAQYADVFIKMDKDMDGLVSGGDVCDYFVHSNLPQNVLARIWDLVDIQRTGYLNQEQFIVAVHLANEQIASRCTRELPASLPAALVPPSLRPVILTSKEYEETNKLLAEIDKIRKEHQSIEAQSGMLLSEAGKRSAEISSMATAMDTLTQTALSLTAQRSLAERYVASRSERLNALRLQLTEVKEAVKDRKAKVETLQGRLVSQQITIQSQEEEVAELRGTIADRKREETALLQQVAERRSRVVAVEAENKAISLRNDLEAKKISHLESIRTNLFSALDKYAKLLAGSTTTVEPEDALIKQLTTAVAAEKESVAEAKRNSAGASQPLFQMNTGDNFANFMPFADSGKSALSGVDPFSSGGGLVDASGTSSNFWATSAAAASLDPFEQDPFMPSAVSDPFSPQAKASSDRSKSPFDPKKFDMVFGSAPVESTDYFFATTNSNGGSGSKKAPPPRPLNQPNVNRIKSSSVTDRSLHSTSPKTRPLGAPGKAGNNNSASRGHGGGGGGSGKETGTMNEADQIRWATRESRRAAQKEEKLRAKEEADLELAIKLSRLEAAGTRSTN